MYRDGSLYEPGDDAVDLIYYPTECAVSETHVECIIALRISSETRDRSTGNLSSGREPWWAISDELCTWQAAKRKIIQLRSMVGMVEDLMEVANCSLQIA
jgi:hypothetical protein